MENPSDNSFHLKLTPVTGSSPPAGTVDGMIQGDEVTAKVSGPRCNASFKFHRGAHSASPQ
jgi:hypothetical protein